MRKMFSKNQIKELAIESILQGGLEDKEVHVGEIIEDGDTELIDLSEYINPNFAKSHTFYCKALVKHGLLNIVVSGKFVAGSSAGANPTILTNFYPVISGIASKIYRADGTTIDKAISSSSPSANGYIVAGQVIKEVGTMGATSFALIRSSAKENIDMQGFSFGTIAEDTSAWMDFRVMLVL